MKLLQLFKRMRTTALILILAMVAVVAVAPEVHAADGGGAHLEDGQAGDHHAEAAQGEMLHWSSSIMFWEYVTFGIVLLILGFVVFPKLLGQLN
ncbi:MAG: hypothetical protein ACYTDT_11270, partial [Planctomycetota bacterium]